MTMLDWANIHEKGGFSAATVPLAVLSLFYGMGVRLRVKTHKRSRRESLPGFVLSIGNLTVGGTGKTPAVCMVADWALNEGYRPVVLSRGYGSRHANKVLEVSDQGGITATPVESGDEPYLLASRLPGIPVIICKRRYQAGLLARKKYGTDFYILDDGFQHLALERNLDLVFMDAASPFGNGHLLPWGPLREPIGHLHRADAFVFTRSKEGSKKSRHNTMDYLKKKFPGKPLFDSDRVPEKVIFPRRDKDHAPEFLKRKRIIAFAGIARPDAFRYTLASLGAEPAAFKAFRDHHRYTPAEIRHLIEERDRLHADCLVTTEKDWVRLKDLGIQHPDLAFLRITFELRGEREKFFTMIKETLGQGQNN
jgi:tetraacyldisaccharide 4'-kinase